PADRSPGGARAPGDHGRLRQAHPHRPVLDRGLLDREHRRDRLCAGRGQRLQPPARAGRRADGAHGLVPGHLPRPRLRTDHVGPVTGGPMEQDAEQAVLEVAAVRRPLHRAPLRHPFVTAARRTEAVEYVVAEVELAGGAVGQGSAAETVAVTGEDAASILDALDGPLGAALRGARGTIGELSARIAGPMPGATSSKAALEVALHDA